MSRANLETAQINELSYATVNKGSRALGHLDLPYMKYNPPQNKGDYILLATSKTGSSHSFQFNIHF